MRGLGLRADHVQWKGDKANNVFGGIPHWDKIEQHVNNAVLGDSFIMKLSIPDDKKLWGTDFPFRVSSCDASQHRTKLSPPKLFPVPFATPIIINNAAGVIKNKENGKAEWKRVVVPPNTQSFEDWVVIGIEEFRELDIVDYELASKSAMDVGMFYVEESYIFTHTGSSESPNVHLRDGTIFPQDFAMNATVMNRRGQLTREAIFRMLKTLERAKYLDILFCGVAKIVVLKLFNIIIDYYIKEVIKDDKWNPTEFLLPDNEIMRFLLPNENFNANTFDEIYVTCPIVYSYYTKSNMNARSESTVANDLKRFEQLNHSRTLTVRQLLEEAFQVKVAMFFAGHSNTDQCYLPRYEFVYYDEDKDKSNERILQVLSAIRFSTLDLDDDHLRTLDEPILVPSQLMEAHRLSKEMGSMLVQDWTARMWQKYFKLQKEAIV